MHGLDTGWPTTVVLHWYAGRTPGRSGAADGYYAVQGADQGEGSREGWRDEVRERRAEADLVPYVAAGRGQLVQHPGAPVGHPDRSAADHRRALGGARAAPEHPDLGARGVYRGHPATDTGHVHDLAYRGHPAEGGTHRSLGQLRTHTGEMMCVQQIANTALTD